MSDDIELGPQHEQLISELYALCDRIEMSRDERLIVEMAIQMVEYLDYRVVIDGEDDRSPMESLMSSSLEEMQAAVARDEGKRRPSRIRFTFEDFERLICSGGFELIDGRLEPR